MYADDTTIYINTEDFPNDNLAKYITTDLDKVDVWLKHNKLPSNVEKIELLQLSIDGKPIEHVTYFKFLGILFDENLTWKCHHHHHHSCRSHATKTTNTNTNTFILEIYI